MRRLLRYIGRYRLRYAFGILCTLATATMAMAIPFLIRDAINSIENRHPERLVTLVELMCAAAVLMGVSRWFSRFVIFNCGRDIEYDLRNDLFAHLVTLPPAFYERVRTGDLMSRLINDLTQVRLMVGIGILTFANTPLYWIYALAIMASLNWQLTLASVVPYLLLFAGIWRLAQTLMERSLSVQEGLGAISAKVQESLAGIHVVKAYTLQDQEHARFRKLNDEYNEQGIALARVRGALFPLIRAAAATSTMVVLIYGSSLVMAHQISIGDLVAFMFYLAQLAWPTTSLGWMLSIYQRGKASMKRLDEILETPGAEANGANGVVLQTGGAVELDHVWFSYFDQTRNGAEAGDERRRWALRDVSVRVAAGKKLAIVGRTGAGKSTIVKLLTRLIEPTRGRVLFDSRDLRELPLAALRRAVGVVPQEPTLFSDTVARNVAFGRLDATAQEIETAARVAGLEPDIEALPRGLQTTVGERGMALSGGQKQRITIARVLAYNPSVVVLDDALSSVDTETEHAILSSLGESVRDRTTIVISHRASTVRDADHIIVLDGGVVAEQGTHEELMTRGGIYADLFRRQLLSEELARY